MSIKEEVIRLVEGLPESDLLTVRRLLQGLALTRESDEGALRSFLASCPEDDEPETPAERAAVQRAKQEYEAGKVIPHEQVTIGRPD